MQARLLALTSVLAFLMCAGVAYAVTLTGTDDPDVLFGTTAADKIDAKGDFDIVFGLSGDDDITGGAGGDNIQADATCPAGSKDPEACDQTAGSGDDTVEGNSGDDAIAGGRGDDEISGGSGADNIQGGPGRDDISAGVGNDAVYGQGGHDRLSGGSGRDDLVAGPGNDSVYARDSARDRVDCGTGRDIAVVDRSDRVSRNCERVGRW